MAGQQRPRPRWMRIVLILVPIGVLFAAIQATHAWRQRDYAGVAPVCRVDTRERIVALSFDDGPDPEYTPAVLRLLARDDARATFFVIGEHAAQHPDLVGSIIRSGNELGNHSWSHPRLSTIGQSGVLAEFERAEALLGRWTTPTLIRAPYGDIDAASLARLEAEGLRPVHWSIPVDHYVDGLGLAPGAAATAILRAISNGDIILAHDAADGGVRRDSAIATLHHLLPMLGSRGYRVVSVGTLLDVGEGVLAAPRPWFWQTGFACPAPGS